MVTIERHHLTEQWNAAARRGFGWWRRMRPPQLFVLSFLLLILFGTIGFRLLPGLHTGERMSWVDALFMTTSAVCVTGLQTIDIAVELTTLGQAFLLLLIQLGGLGVVTFTTIIIMILGGRVSLRAHSVTVGVAEVAPHIDFRHLALGIFVFTAVFEATGAFVLWLSWGPQL